MNKRIELFNKNLILKFVLLGIMILYCYNQAILGGSSDFKIFYQAANHFFETGKLYNIWYEMKAGAAGLYLYAPVSIYFFKIFTYLPYTLSLFIWLLCNLYFLYRVYILLSKYIEIDEKYKWVIVFSLLISLRFILCIFERGQMNLFILYLMLSSIDQLKNKQHFRSALFLSIGILIKLMPIVLIPYFIYRKQFKPLIYTFLICAMMICIPALKVGWNNNITLNQEWLSTINPLDAEKNKEEEKKEEKIHSINSVLGAFLMNNDKPNYYKRHLLNLDYKHYSLILNVVRLLFILIFLYFLHTKPFKRDIHPLHQLWELSYLFICTALIFPHQQKYAFVFIIPASFYLSYFIIKNKLINGSTIVLLIIYLSITLFSSNLIFGFAWKDFAEYYKALTFAVLIIYGCLFYYRPTNEIKNNN